MLKASTPPSMATLILLTSISVLAMTMFLPSLSIMADDFGVDYSVMNLAVSGYLLFTAVLQIIVGPLSDLYGRRPVLLVMIGIFIGSSLVCATTKDATVFLIFRFLQGTIIGGAAVSRAVIRDIYPAKESASRLGYIGMAMAIAPIIAPLLGGLLAEAFGWRSNFWVFSLLGFAILMLCWLDLGETNHTRSATFMDQFKAYPELFRSKRFWGYSTCSSFSAGAFFVFLSGAPLVAQSEFGIGQSGVGLVVGTITIGFFVGSFLSGRLSSRYDLTTMIMAGRWFTFVGLTLGLSLLLFDIKYAWTVFGATIWIGFGNGLTLPSASAGSMSVRPQLAGSASGLSGALNVAIGALLSSATGVLLVGENAALTFLTILFTVSVLALLAGLWVSSLEKKHEGFE